MPETPAAVTHFKETFEKLRAEVAKFIVGQQDIIEQEFGDFG